jgi:hypothetical protein
VATSAPAFGARSSGKAQCPTAAQVGAALGMTLPPPRSVSGGGGLPAGVTGVVCDYRSASSEVLVEVFANVDPSYVQHDEQSIQARSASVRFTPVTGLGDQAVSYSYSLGSGADAEGVLATKGSNFVGVYATRTPASLTQIEHLVSELLT